MAAGRYYPHYEATLLIFPRDRTEPIGYKVSMVSFKDGEPVDRSTSTTAAKDIFANADNSVCPDDCFRPAGLVFDSRGRLFVSSDASGEIYMITRESSIPTPTSQPHAPSTSAAPVASPSTSTGAGYSWKGTNTHTYRQHRAQAILALLAMILV